MVILIILLHAYLTKELSVKFIYLIAISIGSSFIIIKCSSLLLIISNILTKKKYS